MASDNRIYMSEGSTLNLLHKEAWDAVMPPVATADEYKRLPKDEAKARELTAWLCANFWAIRPFGPVMSTGVNEARVRGPVQLSFATPVYPILPLGITSEERRSGKTGLSQCRGR